MEINLKKRLDVARENLAFIQAQRDEVLQEAERLNICATKYIGVIEYLVSLEGEEAAE